MHLDHGLTPVQGSLFFFDKADALQRTPVPIKVRKPRTQHLITRPLVITGLHTRESQLSLDLILMEPLLTVRGDFLKSSFLDGRDIACGHRASVSVDERRDTTEQEVWSDFAVAQLHEGLLLLSMATLGGRNNAEEKQEVLDWIFRPDFITRPGKKAVDAIHIPFSFARCCALMGWSACRLRDGLIQCLQDAGAGALVPEEFL